MLRANSEDGLLGRELFLDGVHLNLRGCYLVGDDIAQKILGSGVLGASKTLSPTGSFADSLRDLGLTVETLATAYETTAKVVDRYSAFRDFDSELRSRISESYFDKAQRLRSGVIEPGEAGTESLTLDVSGSL